ncbi:MAG: molybdenum cofactor biosynthesis protein MoaE [Nevskiales bacterium]|nr:molybdenum cofactor biosynthesis protein MoaE [Nevskiales bacterium]
MSALRTPALELAELLEDTASPDCGALVVFGGTVRHHNEGRAVVALEYSAYAPLAEKLIAEIERDTCRRFGVSSCRIVHRIGKLKVGDAAIYAVVRAAHRREAFAAAQFAVDAVKHQVPIWKEEFFADGGRAFVTGCCISAEDAQLPHAHHDHAPVSARAGKHG